MPRRPSIISVVMMMMVVMVVMMVARVVRPDANDDTAVMMVMVVMMTHLHRNLRDPHSVSRALILRALRFRKTGIVGLQRGKRVGNRIEKIAVTHGRCYFALLHRRCSLCARHRRERRGGSEQAG